MGRQIGPLRGHPEIAELLARLRSLEDRVRALEDLVRELQAELEARGDQPVKR